MAILTCPHCQFSKDVPEEKLPDQPVRLRCRKCGESFMFDPAALAIVETVAPFDPTEYPEEEPVVPSVSKRDTLVADLPPVIDLFARSWEVFKQRVWLLLGIYIVTILTTLVPALCAGVFVGISAGFGEGPGPGSVILVTVAVLLGLLLFSWGMIAMVYATVDANSGFKASFGAAKSNFWAFCWMFGLLSFIVAGGGLLLVIPGVLFATWFLFAQYILAVEGVAGMDSLLKSREYVRGYFWAVLLRLLTLWVATFLLMLVLGWIPLVGDLLSLFLFPFNLIYQHLLYCDLREAPRESLPAFWGKGLKLRWLGVAALGYLALPAAFWLAGGPAAFDSWVFSWKVDHGLVSRQPRTWEPQPVVEEKLGEEPPAAVRVGRKKMRTLLKQSHVEAPPGGTSVGPAALVADRFWDGGSAPHLWLKVRLAGLPNLFLAREQVASVSIQQVEDEEGDNRYDGHSMFEKAYFQKVALQPTSPETSYMEGIRDVYLRKGSEEDELRRIRGVLHLSLPTGIEVVELTPSMMGRDYTIAGHDISYKRLEGPAVTLDLVDSSHLLQVVGYNAAGKPLAPGGSNVSQQGDLTSRTYLFQGEVFSVRLYVARTMVEQDYPFELKLAEH